MQTSTSVNVKLAERSYPIWIGTNQLDEQLRWVAMKLPHWKHAVLIADANVQWIAESIRVKLESVGLRCDLNLVPSGETSKSADQLIQLWNSLLDQRADRKSVIFAIGGGVIGDLAGFVAASYMRGIRLVQVPTTLLSMVDSSVGGKTGINLPKSKNIVGAFWQPHAVCIDTSTLATLPRREYLSGLAEVVKYGIILDKELFHYLETNQIALLNRDSAAIEHVVKRSCELKASVVSADERETTGLRAVLNYGHTFGHAIESKTAYGRYLHGEAVAIGMSMAGQLAVMMGLWSQTDFDRQQSLMKAMELPTRLEETIATDELLGAMQLDKKTENGVLNLILPTRLGNVEIRRDAPRDLVIQSIKACTV